jgi:hypothetical protein
MSTAAKAASGRLRRDESVRVDDPPDATQAPVGSTRLDDRLNAPERTAVFRWLRETSRTDAPAAVSSRERTLELASAAGAPRYTFGSRAGR